MDHKFQVNLHGIISLLSNNLYSGPQVFVRELLQNGVDALRARFGDGNWNDARIEMEVVVDGSGRPTLIFQDNGIGLTEVEIHRFLATIGESSKRDDLGAAREEFIGQFGIGLLWCFMVADDHIDFLLLCGRESDGMAEFRRLLSKRLRCATVPEGTFSRFLLPLFRQGDRRQAENYHRRSIAFATSGAQPLLHASFHLRYLALAGRLSRGIEVLEKIADLASETRKGMHQFHVGVGAHSVLRRLAETGTQTVRLRLPPQFPLYRPDSIYAAGDMAEWFHAAACEMAAQFDARNGNALGAIRAAVHRQSPRITTNQFV